MNLQTLVGDPLWRFGTLSVLSFRGLFMWFTPFPYVTNMFVAPFVQVGLFAVVTQFATGRPASDAVIIGMAVLSLTFMMNGGILQSFQYERDFGTFPVILVSRGNRMVTYWSRGALHYADGLLSAVVTLFAASVVFDVDFSRVNVLTVTTALLLIGAAFGAFALFCGNFALIYRAWIILAAGVNSAILALTGVVVARESLPLVLQWAGEVLPLTHGLAALQAGFAGATVNEAGGLLLAEAAVGLTYALVGSGIYRWIEYRARVRGEFHE